MVLLLSAIPAWAGTTTTNGFIYKPALGARGSSEKSAFDSGLDRLDARLAKEIWVGDPNYGATLQTAVTAIGSATAILRVPASTYTLAADLTIPATLSLRPERGAIIAVPTGKTLTINGGLEAGLCQVFSCAGTGKVVFGNRVKEVYPEWWGADEASDDTAAVTAAITTGVPVIFSAYRIYRIDSSFLVSAVAGKEYALIGKPGSVIDGTRSSDAMLMTISGYVMDGGAALGGDVSKGAMAITSTLASSLAAGDVLRIMSDGIDWDPYLPGTYKAEMVQVDSISGTTINLKSGLLDSYTAATTSVGKILCPKITVSGLTIKRNANKSGLLVQYARDVVIENNAVNGARDACLSTNYIYGGVIRNNYATDCWYSGSGTSYGIVVDACQDVLVEGNRVFGGRHGIKCGGPIPNRNITITNNFIDNYHASNQYSLDAHSACEKFIIKGNIIKNGMVWAGTDAIISDNIIDSSTVDSLMIWYSKSSAYKIIRGNVINTTGNHAGIQMMTYQNNLTQDLLDISDNVINATGNSSAYGIQITTPNYATEYITALKVNNNQVVSGGMGFRLGPDGTGNSYTVADCQVLGGSYKTLVAQDVFYYRPINTTASGRIKIRDVVAESNWSSAYVFRVEYAQVVDIQGCTIKAAPNGLYPIVKNVGDLTFINNYLYNFTSYGGLEFSTGITGFVTARDNNPVNCTGTPSFAQRTNDYTSTRTGNRVSFRTAAPTGGSWKKGDLIFNSAAAAAGAAGWMCTSSGTFSTFTNATGQTNGSTNVITGMTSTSGLLVGDYVNVSAGFPTTGPYRVLAVTTTTITLDTNSNSAQNNITVDTPDPVFKAMANLGA